MPAATATLRLSDGRGHRDRDELVRGLPPASRDAVALAPDDDCNGPASGRPSNDARPRASRRRCSPRALGARARRLRSCTRRPVGGRGCRPSRERHPDGRRRCGRRRDQRRSRPTSRRSGRACPGCPAARFLRRRGAAGRRPARPTRASSASVARSRAARPGGSRSRSSGRRPRRARPRALPAPPRA